mmetsp:Transcript_14377/g.41332  ORF Transcript_14377/g.41332 Transcript_14377/m.41332 type:complete len:293 (-) Transcript_14377:669-1547(-)
MDLVHGRLGVGSAALGEEGHNVPVGAQHGASRPHHPKEEQLQVGRRQPGNKFAQCLAICRLFGGGGSCSCQRCRGRGRRTTEFRQRVRTPLEAVQELGVGTVQLTCGDGGGMVQEQPTALDHDPDVTYDVPIVVQEPMPPTAAGCCHRALLLLLVRFPLPLPHIFFVVHVLVVTGVAAGGQHRTHDLGQPPRHGAEGTEDLARGGHGDVGVGVAHFLRRRSSPILPRRPPPGFAARCRRPATPQRCRFQTPDQRLADMPRHGLLLPIVGVVVGRDSPSLPSPLRRRIVRMFQ